MICSLPHHHLISGHKSSQRSKQGPTFCGVVLIVNACPEGETSDIQHISGIRGHREGHILVPRNGQTKIVVVAHVGEPESTLCSAELERIGSSKDIPLSILIAVKRVKRQPVAVAIVRVNDTDQTGSNPVATRHHVGVGRRCIQSSGARTIIEVIPHDNALCVGEGS